MPPKYWKSMCINIYIIILIQIIIYVKHSYFRQTYSCGTCLINIIEFCYEPLNAVKIVGFIALDFRKAFDVINFEILCEKLKLWMQ